MLLGWEDAQRLGLAPSHLGGIFDAFKPKKTRTPDVPVSSAEKKERVAASVFGASVGMLLGPVGVAPGYAIGGRIADSILGKKRKKKQRAIDQVRADEAQQKADAEQRQEDERLRQRHEAQQEAQARRREEVEAEQIRRKAEREDLEAQRQADREEREERRRQALERSREIQEQRRAEQLEVARQAAESTRLPVRDSIQEDDVQTETWGDFWQSVGLGSLGDRDSDPVAEARYQHARETERARLAEKDRQAAQRRADAEKAKQEEEARRAAHEAWLKQGTHAGGEPWTRPIPSGGRSGAAATSQEEDAGNVFSFFGAIGRVIRGAIHGIDETFSPNMGSDWQPPRSSTGPTPPQGTKGVGSSPPPGKAWRTKTDRYEPTLETRPLRRRPDGSPDFESTLSPAGLEDVQKVRAQKEAEKQAERDRAADLAIRQADLARRQAESRQRAADMARAARERQAELERQLAARNRPASVPAPRRRAPAAPVNVWWPEIVQAAQVSRSLSQSIQAGEALAATAQPAEFGAPQVPTWTPAPAPSAPAGTYTMPWGPTSAPVMAPPISWLPQPTSQQAKPATQATQAQQYVFRPGGMTQADSQRAYAALRAGGAVGVHGLVDELTPTQSILVGAVAGVATVALACAVARRFA